MACKKCKINPVWEFTNQTKLCKKCFSLYFEKKVFKTIRKYRIIKNREIILKKSSSLNSNVLSYILNKKFKVKFGNQNIYSDNLSQIAEETFSNILNGKYQGKTPEKYPLYFLLNEEIELYAKINNISGKKIKKNLKIQSLFEKFKKKNPDLEHNIVNAFLQIAQ